MKKDFVNIVFLDDETKEFNFEEKVTIYAEGELTSRTADLIDKGRTVQIRSTNCTAKEIIETYQKYGYKYNPTLNW